MIILLLCVFFTNETKSQSFMTNGDIYDYDINDIFITVEIYPGENYPPPIYWKKVIKNKYYNITLDTLFYIADYYMYMPPNYMDPDGSYSFSQNNLFYITNLNDTIDNDLGIRPENLYCFDTTGYNGSWLDSVYTNTTLCDVITTSIGTIDGEPFQEDSCWTFFEPFFGNYEYSKGLGRTKYYYNDCWNGSSHCEKIIDLIFYKKGVIECGDSPYLTGIDKYAENTSIVSISPNPFTNWTILKFKEQQQNTKVSIINVLGNELKTFLVNGKDLLIEKGELSNGIYFLKFFNSNKIEAFITKIIIE